MALQESSLTHFHRSMGTRVGWSGQLLTTVATHEIAHLLGLAHTPVQEAINFANITKLPFINTHLFSLSFIIHKSRTRILNLS